MELLELVETIKNDCYSYKVNDVLENIQILIDQLMLPNPNLNNACFMNILKIMLEALNEKDVILIGDCLEFGIQPMLLNRNVDPLLFDENLLKISDVGYKYYYLNTYSDELALCAVNNDGKTIRLNSLFSPENEVERWVDELKIKKTTRIVCLYGIGTGLFAEEILKKLPESGKLLINEPNQDIIDYCTKCASEEGCAESEKRIGDRLNRIIEDDRVVMIVEKTEDVTRNSLFFECLKSRDYTDLMGMIIAKHNAYDYLNPKGYLNFLRAINDFRIRLLTNKNTVSMFKEKYMENFLYNIWDFENIYTCEDLKYIIPRDIPAIIVSAGPSLDKNIDLLAEVKDHFLIFAVDTAVRFLLKKKIIPDLIITLDPNKPANYFSDELAHTIPCLFDVDSNPPLVNKHTGKKILFNCRNSYAGILFKSVEKPLYQLDDNGGSVATAAFRILKEFGQEKIILIGQDLAFNNGVSHAGGFNDNSGYQESEVDGLLGGKVTTRADWLGYLKWFEKQIEDINEKGKIQVIDATEGGALIHGSKVMTLRETIASCKNSDGRLPDFCFEKELGKRENYLKKDEFEALCIEHKKAIGKLKEIELKSEDALRICDNLLKGIEDGTVSASFIDKEKKKIYKINEFCRKTKIFPVINEYLITDIIDEITGYMLGTGDTKTVEENQIKMLKLSFESILDSARKIRSKAAEIDGGKNV